jgi:hypothetical protein
MKGEICRNCFTGGFIYRFTKKHDVKIEGFDRDVTPSWTGLKDGMSLRPIFPQRWSFGSITTFSPPHSPSYGLITSGNLLRGVHVFATHVKNEIVEGCRVTLLLTRRIERYFEQPPRQRDIFVLKRHLISDNVRPIGLVQTAGAVVEFEQGTAVAWYANVADGILVRSDLAFCLVEPQFICRRPS